MSVPVYVERISTFIPGETGERFYAEIGRIVTLWGAVDGALEMALKMINRPERNRSLFTNNLKTHELRRDALKAWLRSDSTLEHVKHDGEKILEAVARIKVDRDYFAHGQVLEFINTDPPRINFSKISLSRGRRSDVRTFELSRLKGLSSDLEKLRYAALAFSAGAVGDDSMAAAEIYALAKSRFAVDLENLNTFRKS